MSRHGGGGGGGQHAGTENVVVGPLLTLAMLVPVLGIAYCAAKERWGRILFVLFLIPGMFMVAPWVLFVVPCIVAFIYFRLVKEPKRDRF